MTRSDSRPPRRSTLAAPLRRACIALALAAILVAGSGCVFRVPEGSVYVSKTTGLEGHMLGLEYLLGPSRAVKVRYAGGKQWAQFFYEHYVGDELVDRQWFASEGLEGQGFTWRTTIRLEQLPQVPGRDGDDPLHMLVLTRSVGKRFTGRSSRIVDGVGPFSVTSSEARMGSDRNEFSDDEEIPLVEFYRGPISGSPSREAARFVVKLRLVDSGEPDPSMDADNGGTGGSEAPAESDE